jgi:glutamate/tyrosine decarboxylase-like PLP-dependent enzyme
VEPKKTDENLKNREVPLEMTGDQFRVAGHRLVDEIAGFLDRIRTLPVNRDVRPSHIRRLLPQGSLPDAGVATGALLDETSSLLLDHSLFNGHPRFFGYITSSAAPIGALADLLASAVNPNVGGWQLSPVASEIERQAVRWVAELLGFPSTAGGLFVSGGNMANFVCFLAARHAKAGWNHRENGMAGGEGRMLVYATGETHTWIQKAMDLFGLGTGSLRTIPARSDGRADIGSLPEMIEEDRGKGDQPFLLIGTGGTVSTGAIDPIQDMIAVAGEHDLWMHVDGAYGAPAACLPGADPDLKALEGADSVAVDPHKWLYAPLEAGCALVRDPGALTDAFSYRPPYYHFESDDEPETNFYEYGLQNSRGFRALKVWLSLRQVGRQGFVRMIDDDIRLTGEMYRVFDEHPECEAVTLGLSIATFRYVPADLKPGDAGVDEYLDTLNEELLTRVKRTGEAFLSNAIIDGRFLLRGCIVNFRTTLSDIEALPEIVVRQGREVDREIRPEGL